MSHPTTSKANDGLILSVNAGSSSLKVSLYRFEPSSASHDAEDPVSLILVSTISSITAPPAQFSFSLSSPSSSASPSAEVKKAKVDSIVDHESAFQYFLTHMEKEAHEDRARIIKVCHRIVHGGDYTKPVVMDDESFHHIKLLSDLAPLHNGPALTLIRTCLDTLPDAPSIGYFDTAFHTSIPPHIYSYAIDQKIAVNRGLRKYGFHGLSYAYILRAVSNFLQKPGEQTNLIVLHLGSGASICAIQNGQSLDTTMGLTPASGLPGATRSGNVDPSLVFHWTGARHEGNEDSEEDVGRLSHEKTAGIDVRVTLAEELLNKKSGWKSLAGTTDFGEIVQKMKENKDKPDDLHVLAYDLFADRILGYLGSYFVKLGGKVDALVFAGGIGERSVELRETVIKAMDCLGFSLDDEKNKGVQEGDAKVVDITGGSSRKTLVCWTDEQLEMARECVLEKKFWE